MQIYLILIFLTIFAFLLGWFGLIGSSVITILLITTFVKGHIVIDYFMGLKDVQLKYRAIPVIWLFVVLFLIGIAYYM